MKTSQLVLLECNIDDTSPELYPHILQQLLEHGALDAWLTPIIMKHGRPGVCLAALVAPDKVSEMEGLIYRGSTTLGIRRQLVERSELHREIARVKTDVGEVEIKIGRDDEGNVLNLAPEFSSCESLAVQSGVPLKSVFQKAIAAAQTLIAKRPK